MRELLGCRRAMDCVFTEIFGHVGHPEGTRARPEDLYDVYKVLKP
jgi:hypothetical protein